MAAFSDGRWLQGAGGALKQSVPHRFALKISVATPRI